MPFSCSITVSWLGIVIMIIWAIGDRQRKFFNLRWNFWLNLLHNVYPHLYYHRLYDFLPVSCLRYDFVLDKSFAPHASSYATSSFSSILYTLFSAIDSPPFIIRVWIYLFVGVDDNFFMSWIFTFIKWYGFYLLKIIDKKSGFDCRSLFGRMGIILKSYLQSFIRRCIWDGMNFAEFHQGLVVRRYVFV